MMTTMTHETVVTSNDSIVREFKQKEHSRYYDPEVVGPYYGHLRFDIPFQYSYKLGMRFEAEKVYVYRNDDELFISCLPLKLDSEYMEVKGLISKKGGDPQSAEIDINSDDIYYVINKDWAPFNVGDKITYTYVHETEDEERHIRVGELSNTKNNILKGLAIPDAPWIETGTFKGERAKWFAANYPKVYTCEPSKECYEYAVETLKGCDNVIIDNDLSINSLHMFLELLEGDVNFWLDSHSIIGFKGLKQDDLYNKTYKDVNDPPVLSELDIIAEYLGQLDSVHIFIDDYKLFSREDYPSPDLFIDWAKQNGFEWSVKHNIFTLTKLDNEKQFAKDLMSDQRLAADLEKIAKQINSI